MERKYDKAKTRITKAAWSLVDRLIKDDWNPEQISSRLKLEDGPSVSHEWIYQHIYEDERSGGSLYRHLRCQKKRRKRYGAYSKRRTISNRVSIEKRPAVEDSRRRYGD